MTDEVLGGRWDVSSRKFHVRRTRTCVEDDVMCKIDMSAYGGKYSDIVATLKKDVEAQRDANEAMGLGDRWSEYQPWNMPKIDSSFEGFKIEMRFQLPDNEGNMMADWYHGVVESVVSEKNNIVKIKWDPESLCEGDKQVTNEKLLKTKWNPNKPKCGAWRQYLTDRKSVV